MISPHPLLLAALLATAASQSPVSRDVCNMQVDGGSPTMDDGSSCGPSKEAWYYRSENDDCNYFIYAGCGGNKNRFNSLTDCEKTCQIKPPCPHLSCPESCNPPTRDRNNCIKCTCSKGQKRRVCNKPRERGNGRALMQRWGWDAKTKSCIDFSYGGLPGNDNNFGTEKECKDFCSGV
ncbi:unnamed protein product [Meganyctiphanes norvegica]|uniref:BPTI/Kunitz inhibitor domain-containing protein n=1 Tax=Meganyctiphanes norvegica TaxID=48144 RepID=A0AAV2QUX3_MEGNR